MNPPCWSQAGNKLFGAAIIRKADLSLVVADTNKEMEWPLLHGEVSCLRQELAMGGVESGQRFVPCGCCGAVL